MNYSIIYAQSRIAAPKTAGPVLWDIIDNYVCNSPRHMVRFLNWRELLVSGKKYPTNIKVEIFAINSKGKAIYTRPMKLMTVPDKEIGSIHAVVYGNGFQETISEFLDNWYHSLAGFNKFGSIK